MHQRVAAIDCGTNSIRLLVADLSLTMAGPLLVDVHREMRVVRLGEGVDATGRLAGSALDRTWRALSDYAAIIRASGADAVRMVATSATRDAVNRDEFTEMVRRTLGQPPEVITGEEEAALSFRGAIGDLAPSDGPFLVVDIGGGSTELVAGSTGGAQQAGSTGGAQFAGSTGGAQFAGSTGGAQFAGSTGGARLAGSTEFEYGSLPQGAPTIAGSVSLALGCVRITERVLHSDPPTAQQISAAQAWASECLRGGLAGLPVGRVRTLVAVSGTATTVAAAARGLPTYDPVKIHLSRVPVGQVRRISDFLLHATRAHRAALGYMHPGRVDVIGGGSMILATVAELVAQMAGDRAPIADIVVSEHDILDGIALSLA
jgi:exopolyphosphatase/guanosine-5'-triphosphate,3'-diphosphate pyrophosphatase